MGEAQANEALSHPLSPEAQHTGDTMEESPGENITLQKTDHDLVGNSETNSDKSTVGTDDVTACDMDDIGSQTIPVVDETSSNPYPGDQGCM